jgi:hypothetical protein
MSELLDAALHYSQDFNWFVLPCYEKQGNPYLDTKSGKWITPQPKSPRITSGVLSASNDKEQIKSWWNKWPTAAIGVATGLSKLFVIDIDTKKVDGLNNYHKLGISDGGCIHQFTANKGYHIIFYDPMVKGKASTKEKLGIDTRGQNSFIIVAPTVIYDDDLIKKYVWIDEVSSTPRELTDDVLIRLGQSRKEKQDRGRFITNETQDEKYNRIKYQLSKLNALEICEEYLDWLRIGMALKYELGDSGLQLWEEFTEPYFENKPNSKRWNKLNYYWEHIKNETADKVTGATIWFWSKKGRVDE